jgi:uncharacterized protein YbjT (DUF2867 family)
VSRQAILVIGATGYVGGRLVPLLLEAGYRVRVFGRSMAKLKCRPWAHHPLAELAEGDVTDLVSLQRAAEGCWAVYYLAQAMDGHSTNSAEADNRAARNLVQVAAVAGLQRIINLEGMVDDEDLNVNGAIPSRREVGRILRSSSVPATILRTAMILGSGSASFEVVRYLVDRLPVVISSNWMNTPCQPISVRNVLGYLKGCLESPETIGRTFDIGGREVLTTQQLMDIYAEEAGLHRRRTITTPFFGSKFSALWIHLITPVPKSIACILIEGLRHPAICQDSRIRSLVPQELLSCRETIRLALDRIGREQVETCWSDAGRLLPPEWAHCGDAEYAGGTILECGYRVRLRAQPEELWGLVARIGGKTGWYFGDTLWWLRGWLDRLIGGIGLRGGRRHPTELRVGDALDFWRVLEVDRPNRLLLLAEMKTPGEALLEFRIIAQGGAECELQQKSRFLPRGLWGILYWYGLYPFHQWIFRGMLRGLARAAGKPITGRLQRFTPKLPQTCRIGSSAP